MRALRVVAVVSVLLLLLVSQQLTANGRRIPILVPGDHPTIQEAIDAATDGDVVLVAPGEYEITEPITFRGKAITVRSEAGAEATVIRMGQPSDPDRGMVVLFNGGERPEAVLAGFTVTGGRTGSSGAGISCSNGASPTIEQCTLRGNQGGGFFCTGENTRPTLWKCTIEENRTLQSGGGVSCANGAAPVILDSTIRRNRAEMDGGGVSCTLNAAPHLERCVVESNIAGGGGGGLSAKQGASAWVLNCAFTGNVSGGAGGAIHTGSDGGITLLSCVISANVSRDSQSGGGAAYCGEASGIGFFDCTLADNVAEVAGGVSIVDGFPYIYGTIIWNNAANALVGDFPPSVEYSCLDTESVYPGRANTNLDPLLTRYAVVDPNRTSSITVLGTSYEVPNVVVGPGDYHLLGGSPVVDFIPREFSTTSEDFEGVLRKCGSGVDVGAFEYCNDTDPAYRIAWERGFGLERQTWIRSVAHAGGGGFVLAGSTWDQNSDPDQEQSSIYVLRISEDGDRVWERRIDLGTDDIAHDVLATDDGGILISGSTRADTGEKTDAFVLRLDEDGDPDLDWGEPANPGLQRLGGDGWDRAYGISRTRDGGYVVAGSSTSFGTDPECLNFPAPYVVKLDAAGGVVWERSRSIRGDIGDECGWAHLFDITELADGSFYGVGDIQAPSDPWLFGSLELSLKSDGTFNCWTVFNSEYPFPFDPLLGAPLRSVDTYDAGGSLVMAGGFADEATHAGPALAQLKVLDSDPSSCESASIGSYGEDAILFSVRSLPNGLFAATGIARFHPEGDWTPPIFLLADRRGEAVIRHQFQQSPFFRARSLVPTDDGGFLIAGANYAIRLEPYTTTTTPAVMVGSFDRVRGGEGASFGEGTAFAEARAAMRAKHPGVVFRSTDSISQEFLEGLDLFVLPTISNDVDAILPLLTRERDALFHWVAGGGRLLVLGDRPVLTGWYGDTFHGILQRFDMAAGPEVPGERTAYPISSVTGLTRLEDFTQVDAGSIARPGPATVIARNAGLGALAVIEPGRLSQELAGDDADPVSGPVVIFSDVNTFWSEIAGAYRGRFPQNRELFELVIEYLLSAEPAPPPADGSPRIESVQMADSAEGTPVTVFGTGLGAAPGTVTMDGFEPPALSIISWSDTRIELLKPDGRLEGSIQVETAGGPSNTWAYRLPASRDPLEVRIVSPVPAIDGEPVQVLAGEAVFFEGEATTDAGCSVESTLWNIGDGRALLEGERVIARYEKPDLYTACFIAADLCPGEPVIGGRVERACIQIEVLPRPLGASVVVAPAFPALCDTVTLTGQFSDFNPPPRSHEFCWTVRRLDDPPVIVLEDCDETTGQTLEFTPAAAGNYEASFSVTNDLGESASASRAFTVGGNDTPVVNVRLAGPLLPLAGSPVTFEGTYLDRCGGGPFTCRWDFGDGSPPVTRTNCPSVSTIEHTYALCGRYTVTLAVTDGPGAEGSSTRTISVNAPPVASFAVSPTPAYEGEPVTLDASASVDNCSGIAAHIWDLGDGTRVPGPDDELLRQPVVTHLYAESANYTASLRVVDAAGLRSAPVSVPFEVLNRPPTVFDIRGQGLCLDQPTTFTAFARDPSPLDEAGLTYRWSVSCGQITPTSGPQLTVLFDSPCTAVVEVVAIDPDGAESEPYSESFDLVMPAVSAAVVCPPDPVVAGSPVTFSAEGSSATTGEPTRFLWDFGDGFSGSGPVARHAYCEAGVYEASLTVFERCGVSNTATCDVTVTAPALTARIDCPAGPILEGETVFLSATESSSDGGPITSYLWNLGDGTWLFGPEVEASHCQDGIYEVSLTAFDRCGHEDTVTCSLVVENAPPTASAFVPGRACTGDVVNLTASVRDRGCDDLACSWSVTPPGGVEETIAPDCAAEYTVTSAGRYTFRLEVEDDDALVSGDYPVDVTACPEPPRPEAACAVLEPSTITEGETACFSGAGSSTPAGELVAYRWSFGDGSGSPRLPVVDGMLGACHLYRDDDNFTVTLTVWNSFGQSDECAGMVRVLNAAPVVDAGPDLEVQAGRALHLVGSFTDRGPDDTHDVRWDFGDGGSATSLATSHVFALDGVYTATLTVRDDDGGVGSDTATITVGPQPALVAVQPASVTLSGCDPSESLRVLVFNPTSTTREFLIALEGLDAGWATLETDRIAVAPLGRASLALELHLPPCEAAAEPETIPFSVVAVPDDPLLTGRGSAHVTVVPSPVIRESTVSPPDGALLATTTVAFSWQTLAPSTSTVYLREEGAEEFLEIPGDPGETTRHRLEAGGLEYGMTYEWFARSTCCEGQLESISRLRRFSIERGVRLELFTPDCVRPSFGQAATVRLTNEDEIEQAVTLSFPVIPEGLRSLWLEERVVTLGPGETGTVRLLLDARGARSGEVYPLVVRGVLRRSGRMSEVTGAIEICQPVIQFSLEERLDLRNSIEGINTFELTNLGDPLDEVDNGLVRVEPVAVPPAPDLRGFAPGELIFLDGQEFSLAPGATATFRVQHVDPLVPEREGELVARARDVEVLLETDFGCPGNPPVFDVPVQDLTVCRRYETWYDGDLGEEGRVIPFDLPAGFLREDILNEPGAAPFVAVRFDLRAVEEMPEIIPRHSLRLLFNGQELSPALRNIVPRGDYAFLVPPEALHLPDPASETLARNRLAIHVANPSGQPIITHVDARLILPLGEFRLKVCATTFELAQEYVRDRFQPLPCNLTGFELTPKITAVSLRDAATQSEREIFCRGETERAEIAVEVFNPDWSEPRAVLEYAIRELPAPGFRSTTFGAFGLGALPPFETLEHSWLWEVPQLDERRDYGLELSLTDDFGACLDCPETVWDIRVDRTDFEIAFAPGELFVAARRPIRLFRENLEPVEALETRPGTNRFVLRAAPVCGFEGEIELEVAGSPPFLEATLEGERLGTVGAENTTKLWISADEVALPGRHFVTLLARSEGREKTYDLPVRVTRERGADLVIDPIRIPRVPGLPENSIWAGTALELEVRLRNAGDVPYVAGEGELVRLLEFDGGGHYVQHEVFQVIMPDLSPGDSVAFPVVVVLPRRQFGEQLEFRILREVPDFFRDNDVENNVTEVRVDVFENPVPYIDCLLNVLTLSRSSSWPVEADDLLFLSKTLYPPVRVVWQMPELEDALARRDTEAATRILLRAAWDAASLEFSDTPARSTHGRFLEKFFAGVGALTSCPEAAAGFFRGQIDTYRALFDMLNHSALEDLAFDEDDVTIVHARSPVNLIVEDAAERQSRVNDTGEVTGELPGSVPARLNAAKIVATYGAALPRVIVEGVDEGSCELAVYRTDTGAGQDGFVIFGPFEVNATLRAEVLFGEDPARATLAIDGDGDGSFDELLTPAASKRRTLHSPVLLPGFLGPVNPTRPFTQKIHSAVFREGALEYDLRDGPLDMELQAASGELSWSVGPEDLGTYIVELEVTETEEEEPLGDEGRYTIEVTFPTLERISVQPGEITQALCGLPVQLRVIGHFDDGTTSNVSPAASGTAYESSDPDVVLVNENGVVDVRGRGQAIIAVRNDAVPDQTVEVTVEGLLARFRRGDVDTNGRLELTDPINNLGYQFLGTYDPPCLDACDFNDDGKVDIQDPISNISHQFLGAPPPPPPGKTHCGCDPSPDVVNGGDLGCKNYREDSCGA